MLQLLHGPLISRPLLHVHAERMRERQKVASYPVRIIIRSIIPPSTSHCEFYGACLCTR